MALLQAKTIIILSENQKRIHTELEKSTHQPLHLKKRSEIVLRASEGQSNHQIKREMGIDKNTVRRWRDGFGSHQEQLLRIEKESPHKLRGSIIESLELGIVENILVRQVGRFLKRAGLATSSKPVLVKPKH